AFYLALGCIRVSQYERGRFWLAKSLRGVRWLEHNSNAGSQTNTEINSQAYFFGFQGIAFYYFFCGNFARSKRYAQKALLAAKNYKEPYGIVLSLELLAQSNYRLGYCNLALEQFKNARDEAAKAEFHQLVSAIRISELILSSQTGRLGAKAIETLKEAVGKFQVDDIYSKNELLLEVAQQMILCGRNSDARQILNSVSSSIYRVGHMRQAATLNLRLSYSMYLRGEQESARALLRSHFPRLSTNTDKALIRSYLGLLRAVDPQEQKEENSEPRHEVTAKGIRILLRESETLDSIRPAFKERDIIPPQRFEDPLGDLIDDSDHYTESAFRRVCDSGYLSLIPKMLKLTPGSKAIVIEKSTGRAYLVSEGDVTSTRLTIKPQTFSLIQLLNQQDFVGKNQLTQHLWNSRYVQERHEKSLQSAMTRLKDFLWPKSHWLETTKAGYRLILDVELKILSFGQDFPDENRTQVLIDKTPNREILPLALNARHLQFLKQSGRLFSEYFSSQDWAEVFDVSIMTATRDLNFLVSQKRVMVTGKGRATRYRLN
ncbi:hypothetical protein EBR21_04045, partial [bacterium]|nr:hypothetical protein [bacterium]